VSHKPGTDVILTQQQITPHKVTKPIQLLAAWLVGLVVTDSTFLLAAVQLANGSWERGALVIASIVNVPLFLLALFVLQTRFRAELQEDTYYSEYINKKTAEHVRIDRNAAQDARIEDLERLVARVESSRAIRPSSNNPIAFDSFSDLDWSLWRVALNERHPRFADVREALRAAQIPLSEIFGDDNDIPPSEWVVCISQGFPLANTLHLLRAVLHLDFDGFQFFRPRHDEEGRDDIVIGGYGGPYAKNSPELLAMLQRNVEFADLNLYYKRNTVIRSEG
jgi:hypothetical protein